MLLNSNFLFKNCHAAQSMPVCLKMPGPHSCPCQLLDEMEINLVRFFNKGAGRT
jgi:hypothetical protein